MPVEEQASARLIAALAAGESPPPFSVRSFAQVPAGPLSERAITVDQTNASVVVGERLVVKWMLDEPAPISPRAPRLLEHLAEVGFKNTPQPYAVLLRPDGTLAATVTGFLPGGVDGWEWCVDAVLAELDGGEPARFAADLGRLAAELHIALATPSSVLPEPVDTVESDFVTPALAVLAEAVELVGSGSSSSHHANSEGRAGDGTGSADGDWLADHAPAMAAELAAAGAVPRTAAMVLHGDLHVGQILRWRHGLAVIDFDGNPAVTAPDREPAARDLAQLRTSLAHVARIADRRTEGRHRQRLDEWAATSADELLTAYLDRLADARLEHLLDLRLLRPFEVEQECRELIYAARFLPRWRYAPMGVLRAWFN